MLFASQDLADFLAQRREELRRETTDHGPREETTDHGRQTTDFETERNSRLEDLVREVVEAGRIGPIVLGEAVIVSQGAVMTDVSHVPLRRGIGKGPHRQPIWTVTYAIPFQGEESLLHCRPTRHYGTGPNARVVGQEILVTVNELAGGRAQMEAAFEKVRKEIGQYVAWLNEDLAQFNEGLGALAKRWVSESVAQNSRETIANSRDNKSEIRNPRSERNPKTEIRRGGRTEGNGGNGGTTDYRQRTTDGKAETTDYRLRTTDRKAETTDYRPRTTDFREQGRNSRANEDVYGHILEVVWHAGVAMERNPGSFEQLTESGLRDQLVVSLNTHYQGQVTAESLNGDGRTDILVRRDGHTVFIGECKIWTGAGAIGESIDQLLKYVTWRDTQTALIVFCRGRAASDALKRTEEVIKGHGHFVRQEPAKEGTLRFVLKHGTDPGRTFLVTVLMFHIPGRGERGPVGKPVEPDAFYD